MISILKKWGIKLLSFLLPEEGSGYVVKDTLKDALKDGDKIEYIPGIACHYVGVLKVKPDGRYLVNDELELLLPNNESDFHQTVYKVAQEESI